MLPNDLGQRSPAGDAKTSTLYPPPPEETRELSGENIKRTESICPARTVWESLQMNVKVRKVSGRRAEAHRRDAWETENALPLASAAPRRSHRGRRDGSRNSAEKS